MFNTVKNKWNSLDKKTKNSVKIASVITTGVISFYIFGKSKIKYDNGFAIFDNGLRIYDKDVADIVKKQLNYFEKRDVRKVVETASIVFAELAPGKE